MPSIVEEERRRVVVRGGVEFECEPQTQDTRVRRVKELLYRGRWVFAAAALVAAGTFLAARSQDAGSWEHPLDVAPAAARIVADIDVAAVTRSHLWEVLLEADDEGGVRRIERTCGYDPLDQVEDAVVFIFGQEARPFAHVGFVARGQMARGRSNRERLAECVESVIREQGGAIQQTEIAGERAVASAHGGSHAAFFGADGVVGGDRAVVEAALEVEQGGAPSASSVPEMTRLWNRVSHGRDVVAVARLPERWVPALQRMAGGVGGDLSSLTTIEAVGIGVGLRTGVSVGAAARTGSSSDAQALASQLRGRVDQALADPMARLSVAGAALRRIEVEADGSDVVLTFALTDDQIDDLWDLWRELRERAQRERHASEADAEAAPADATALDGSVPPPPADLDVGAPSAE